MVPLSGKESLMNPKWCDVCGCTITDTLIDGKTRMGPWATMCSDCHKEVGVGFGPGKGQRYELRSGQWIKVEG